MKHVEIRAMAETDLETVMKNERRSYAFPWTEGVMRDCLGERYECAVCLYEKALVGHVIMSHVFDETHLLNLSVVPEMRRKGLGLMMLEHVLDRARERNASAVYLEVRESNQGAIQLYANNGFNEVGSRPNYYPNGHDREDAVLMTVQLNETGMIRTK